MYLCRIQSSGMKKDVIQLTANLLFTSITIGLPTEMNINQLLATHHLGTLLQVNETKEGAMKQTLSVSSTKGNWIFKGNPVYEGQLEEEKFFIDALAEKTTVNLPIPYRIHPDAEPLGFACSIMPTLPGKHLHDLENELTHQDRMSIAGKLATLLKELHAWQGETYGQLDPIKHTIVPFESSYKDWLFNRIVYWFHDAKQYSTLMEADENWLKNELHNAEEAFTKAREPRFIMGDFKPGNFLLEEKNGDWAVSGLFDFTNSYFADPLTDLTKMILYYDRHEQVEIGKFFISQYVTNDQLEVQQRLRIHLLHQLVLDWGFFHAMEKPINVSFEKWVKTRLARFGLDE